MYRFFSILSLLSYVTPLLHNTLIFASELQAIYDKENRLTQIQIPDVGKIQYTYGEDGLSEIQRLDEQDHILYTHRYHSNQLEELPFDLGAIEHRCFERQYVQTTPYGIERCVWDDQGKLIEHEYNDQTYKPIYDEEGSLLSEFPLAEGVYDDDGRLIQKGDFVYTYNEKDQLIEVVSKTMKVKFFYDDKGRRVSKKIETDKGIEEYKYLYLEQVPIVILKNGTLHHLQVPLPPNIFTLTKFVAFETNGETYIPIYSFPNNISKLINKETKETISFCIDPYGCNLHKQTQIIPFLFAGKEYDNETGLVYFGHRYYDPTLRTWLTADPFRQDENHLYSYCFQNPLRYTDPDGRFTIVIPLIDLTLGVLGKAIMKGLCLGGAAWLGAKGVEKTNEYFKEQEKKKNKNKEKITKGFPNRPLPKTEDGVPIPDTDAPHTQLGIRKGRKGTYGKAREFDAEGKPVRDIEFTDHERPENHPNPHQHRYQENSTGGSRERMKTAEPLSEWSYE